MEVNVIGTIGVTDGALRSGDARLIVYKHRGKPTFFKNLRRKITFLTIDEGER
jgi:hypothetical protein